MYHIAMSKEQYNQNRKSVLANYISIVSIIA